MKIFEYKAVTRTMLWMLDSRHLEFLNDEGAYGWELITVELDRSAQKDSQYVFLFKREITPEDKQ